MQEIERKFLVSSMDFKEEAFRKQKLKQGFLSVDPARTVRVRVVEDHGYLTIKGKAKEEGISRFEWERELSLEEAEALYDLCLPGKIEKTRYFVRYGNHLVEVDEFHGDNKGLLIAEIELKSEHESYPKPLWLGEEVTGQPRYYNSQLSQHSYTDWDD